MSKPDELPRFTKENPFPAVITENRKLNREGSSKDTRHLVVALTGSDLRYKAGDSLGVFPSNPPDEVEEILRCLGAEGDELVSPQGLKLAAPVSLREVLTVKLALAGPTRKLVETLAQKTSLAEERAKLEALLAPEAKEALSAFLAERHFVDLLAEFPGTRLTPQEFVDHQRRLMPRLYSIASSPRLFPTEVHLTVAVVRYEANKRSRVGVCSTYLAERIGLGLTPTPVFVVDSHFGPPDDGSKDCIMVGPGTGIAPFRAFIQDRVASGATGRNWLFFGDQKRATDFLYEEEWQVHLERGQLSRLDVAFSRDQVEKVYVQDRMRQNAAELWRWLQAGAYFFVCGDAKRMAKDVDAALHEIAVTQGGLTPPMAADYVKLLKREKRYQRDVY
jgi:sulfite reductase (NADPH) flavoprotein alpha-component